MTLPPDPITELGDEETVTSPCVSVCTLDRASGLCIGCLRTIKEIGAWRTMTMAEKRATVAACAKRAKVFVPRGKDGQPLPDQSGTDKS